MANPSTHLTAFNFYCDSFDEIPDKIKENVGYEVKPIDIGSINISPFEINRLSVTLTVIYWKDPEK